MITDRAISPTAVAAPTEAPSRTGTVHSRPERQAPDVTAFCHRCERDTGTVYRLMRSGHVGNLCTVCGTCRRGRPYVPMTYLTSNPEGPRTSAVMGVHERTDR